jgi:hypothetical protein
MHERSLDKKTFVAVFDTFTNEYIIGVLSYKIKF